MTDFSSPWSKLVSILSPSTADLAAADELISLYETDGCWKKTLPGLLGIGIETVALFYAHLERAGGSTLKRYPSSFPVDSFTFMNVRALGRGDEPGTLLDAAKIVPSLRAECLHLGPFTVYDHHVIYAVSSVRSISSRVTDLELERRGFTREWQLAALVHGCHLLGKAAGFDIEPHVTQFAIPVLEHPEAFRWIRLDLSKKQTAHPAEEILSDEVQRGIVHEVKKTVGVMMREAGESTLEYASEEERLRREPLHYAITGTLIGRGLWTIPSQIWAGDGIPEFNYMHADGYPVFCCRDRKGKDRRAEALNIVTPFRFDRDHSLFDDIFPYWRDRFGFNAVRFDSVDHIFDSCEDFDSPRSDRPAPSHLARCVSRARDNRDGVVMLAERMGTEFAEYSSCGFDALLGDDMFGRIGKDFVKKTFSLSGSIARFNERAANPVTVCFAVDTHDTGDPHLLGAPLVESLSSAELLHRHFLSRFASCGKGSRPKYEVVGCADRSFGLYRANVTEENMTLRGDEEHLRRYHFLEDVYDEVSAALRNGGLDDVVVNRNGARWTITDGSTTLYCAIAFPEGKGLKLPAVKRGWSALMYACERSGAAPRSLPAGECCVTFHDSGATMHAERSCLRRMIDRLMPRHVSL